MTYTLPDERADRAIARLKELRGAGDPEATHSEADRVLCDLLKELNFDDVVAEFEAIEKWYA